jgi:hypothetical protein
MLEPSYRKIERDDVLDRIRGPSRLLSSFSASFLVIGCGVFALVYALSKSTTAAGVVSGALFALSTHSILRHRRDCKKRECRIGEAEAIEVIEVHALEVVKLEFPGSTGPALCFQLPGEQILFLYGQWLFEPALYRAPAPVGDGNQERFNLSDDPFGFPSDSFALHRWRGEVRPFWIEVRGSYLAPRPGAVPLPNWVRIREVEILAGTIHLVSTGATLPVTKPLT